MTPELKILMNLAGSYAETRLIDTKNQLSPTWFIPVPGNDELRIITTPWGSHMDRQIMLAEIRRVLRDTGAPAYAIISEVWLVTHDAKEWPKDAPEPRLDPRRQEKVGAYAVARSGERDARLWDITRDYKGTVRMLTRSESGPSPDAKIGGALVRMFEER